jgi:prepilin-type N-terminal cleavage/methylation domain-containing protein
MSGMSRNGYTLIEMLVVISITVLMSGVLLAYNRESEKQLVIGVEQARVVGFLSRAKSFALGKYTGSIVTGPHKGENASPLSCAFGVSFDAATGKMTLFQDLPSAGLRCMTGGTQNFDKEYTTSDPQDLEEIDSLTLDGRVRFRGNENLDIAFEAPYLRTYVNGQELGAPGNPSNASVVIEISDDATRSVTVDVGNGGQIVSH